MLISSLLGFCDEAKYFLSVLYRIYLVTVVVATYISVTKELLFTYSLWMQALSSYVFITANVILHAKKGTQFGHLDELLPPIVPLLTSHHHTLRGFTQVCLHKNGECFSCGC